MESITRLYRAATRSAVMAALTTTLVPAVAFGALQFTEVAQDAGIDLIHDPLGVVIDETILPNFYGSGPTETKIVAGVTSFGKNGNCAGTGGVFRMDRQDVLDFVHTYLP